MKRTTDGFDKVVVMEETGGGGRLNSCAPISPAVCYTISAFTNRYTHRLSQ